MIETYLSPRARAVLQHLKEQHENGLAERGMPYGVRVTHGQMPKLDGQQIQVRTLRGLEDKDLAEELVASGVFRITALGLQLLQKSEARPHE